MKLLYLMVSVVTFVVMTVVDAVFWFLHRSRGKAVSKVVDPLLLMPASTIAEKIRSRTLRAEDVMASYISRAKEVNPDINAIIGDQYDRALRTAQELDTMIDSLSADEIEEKYPQASMPLLGVPLSVKECFAWTGMSQTSGVPGRRHVRASCNAPVLDNFINAGAIPFINTNTSEACMWFESSNYVSGCTNNAYDTNRIVGGSSGGEGCVISAGASVIGIGSDIGGSIRMPSFFNGIFGHKPSPGVVSNTGQWPIASPKSMDLLATGPMCRYATDLIPCLKVMAGSEGLANLELDTKVELQNLRVISVPDDAGSIAVSRLEPELRVAQQKVVQHLMSVGANVTEMKFKEFRMTVEMWTGRMNLADDGPTFAMEMSGGEGGQVGCVSELCKWVIRKSEHTLPAIALGIIDDHLSSLNKENDLQAVKRLDVLKEKLIELLGKDGVLLYPSHPHVAPYHSHPIFTPFNFAYTALFNALGFPVTQCPLGLSPTKGVPLGIQVIAAPNQDHLSLAVAKELEVRFGGWANPGEVCSR